MVSTFFVSIATQVPIKVSTLLTKAILNSLKTTGLKWNSFQMEINPLTIQSKPNYSSIIYFLASTNFLHYRVPEFLHAELTAYESRKKQREQLAKKEFYKYVNFDIDQLNKSDRKEWGHIKYQRCYNPREAFEMVVHWSVGTGALISEVLHGWARKSQSLGLTLLPVPAGIKCHFLITPDLNKMYLFLLQILLLYQ